MNLAVRTALSFAALVVIAGCASVPAGQSQQVGAKFKDCPECPQMVVIPAGQFVMGSPETDPIRDRDEGPQRTVTIPKPLAVSTFEVTRGEFARFVAATNHQAATNCSVWTGQRSERVATKSWQDPNYPQTDAHPVACINWLDAKAYVAWLSTKTGKTYRMLSEAEWEYGARSGAAGKYSFGEDANQLCTYGNIADITAREAGGAATWNYAECRDGFGLGTAPVGSFKANAFGLYDMHGNVWEWVEDCHNATYEGGPTDGSAWVTEGCATRVDRGGAFYNNRGTNRSAERALYPAPANSGNIGLRVARVLD